MSFKKLNFDELTKELDKYKFKQLHIHHTWKPTHKSFTGNNHIQMQQNMKNYHVNTNKWSDIAQHLTLFPDGVWLTGRPFNISPASISGWNTGALCVEMIGNFDVKGTGQFNDLGYDKLEKQQRQEILKLIKYFIDKYGEQSIKFHNEHPSVSKTCPGTSLNKQVLIQEAKNIDNKPATTQPKPKYPDSVDVKINFKGKPITIQGILRDGTNYVPIRTLEEFGIKVDWDNVRKEVVIR